MKGKTYNLLKLKELESEDAGCYPLVLPGTDLGSENHFFDVEQEEQSPEQPAAAGVSFLATSFLAASLYPFER